LERESRKINTAPISLQEQSEEQRKPFSEQELQEALKLSKKGKEPGPDAIRMELLKWLDPFLQQVVLATINVWWEKMEASDELYYARVATIYKKGDTEKAANYCPISLLSLQALHDSYQAKATSISGKTPLTNAIWL
jgi:hypothetical protein